MRETKTAENQEGIVPRWYRIELIAVKKNSETISTLPLSVISVLLSVEVAIVSFRCVNSS